MRDRHAYLPTCQPAVIHLPLRVEVMGGGPIGTTAQAKMVSFYENVQYTEFPNPEKVYTERISV